ncbi:hypothetical protein MKX01_037059 [Papaver californicum]|nr:hypothetical protein MKX01_037059 [Papaver californicum]
MADRHSVQAQAQRTSTTRPNGGTTTGGGGGNTFLKKNSRSCTKFKPSCWTINTSYIRWYFTISHRININSRGFNLFLTIDYLIWIPVGTVLFIVIAWFLYWFWCALLAVCSWTYKYNRHPPGSDRVDYARSQITDTSSHMKDYAQAPA